MDSSTIAAFCWVTWSIWLTAELTSERPVACSRAELAMDLKREVRDLIKAGKTDAQVKEFLVTRYGDFVLYKPEVKPLTWVLWFGPFFLLVLAIMGMAYYLRQRQGAALDLVFLDPVDDLVVADHSAPMSKALVLHPRLNLSAVRVLRQ